MAASSPAVRGRRRAPARSWAWTRIVAWSVAALAAAAVLVGVLFAGSPGRLADGTRIAGVDVGGLTPAEARARLERRAAALQNTPVVFTAGGRTFRIRPKELGVAVDWRAAVAAAERRGGGFRVVRGYRRLELQLFPADISPRVHAYGAAVTYELGQIAKKVDRPHREAALVRHGLHVSVAPGATGLVLDRARARAALVRGLASFDRRPVALPVRVDPPAVTVATLLPAQRQAARVLAAPVTLRLGQTAWRVPRWRLATLLDLPRNGGTELRLAGPAADAWFARLARRVDRAPRDATWRPVSGGEVALVPAKAGVTLDAPRSAARILAAAERSTGRVATLAVASARPRRTTAAAAAMGITGTVGSYQTIYGGDPNRIHNVQLVAHLIDGKLIAPGATFSFNGATGARTAAKGFLTAPVIINGELQTGLGGGVCQVSTTVFNAAYEAGLPITERTNHALYISHYPLGRDATVDYPDVDLRFVNDTDHWLLLRTFVGPYSLSVVLYGTPQHRRVESTTAPLRVVAAPPVEKTVDATLKPGEIVVDDPGVPAQSTWVERKVYSPAGKLLSDQTWYSSYRAEPRIERVGPKKAKTKPKKANAKTATTATQTTPDRPH
ncbi:MAG TPA: VanW family protein [Gaiellaceae bacterium]|nr:VanW family protein [Gaiellaceae bacterium]